MAIGLAGRYSAFFSVYSAFFSVSLPFSRSYPQSALCNFGQNSAILPTSNQDRKTEMSAELSTNHKSDNYLPEAHEAGSRWVSMSNALTRAGHGLTLAEKRIVAIAASKLDSRQILRPGEVPTTKIAAAEYAETFDITLDAAYQQLSSAAKALHKRHITFFEPSFKRNGKALKPTRVEMNWVGQVNYQEGEGWVELHWWPALMRHLVGLTKQFTSYQLQQASALRSAHSWRLLELLMRFKSTGWAEYSIEDFCEAMDATEKQRSDFAAIRRKIIEPAIKELTEKDGWIIQWRPIKAGRKVRSLRFEFMRNPQSQLDL
jgi:plasmid replication initiation protein